MFKMGRLLAGAIGAAAAMLGSTGAIADNQGSVYGDIRYGLDHSDSSGPASTASNVGPDTDLRDLNSFIGVKASTGAGDVRVFGGYETYVGGEYASILSFQSQRQLYAGVETAYGTVAYGRMFTQYAKVGIGMDPFHNTSLGSANGGPAGTSSFSPGVVPPAFHSYGQSPLFTGETPVVSNLGAGIQGAQLTYQSPTLFGATVNGAMFFDRNDDSASGGQESHDYGLGAAWTGMGITAGVQWLQVNDQVGGGTFLGARGNGDATATRLHASYAAQRWGAAVSAERIDLQGVLDEEYLFVSGWFGVLPNTRIAASAGMTNETGFEGTGLTVGVFHDVLDNFTVHAGGSWYDLAPDSVNGAVDDSWIAAVGASYKFDLGFSSR
jgi:predicted porin